MPRDLYREAFIVIKNIFCYAFGGSGLEYGLGSKRM